MKEELLIKKTFTGLNKNIASETQEYKGVIIPKIGDSILYLIVSLLMYLSIIMALVFKIKPEVFILIALSSFAVNTVSYIIYKINRTKIVKIKTLINNNKYIIADNFTVKTTFRPYTKVWSKFSYLEIYYIKDEVDYKFQSSLFPANLKYSNNKVKIYVDINAERSDYYTDIFKDLKQ